ncbi:uncharacterized protein [Euwallacea fornicatus]|uniref:uncharacterized protein n=1 Tax=Euwallacea fornicatus TaxID=995702 RepID=UPI00338E00D3
MESNRGNILLYFADKSVSKVKIIWKALHIAIYVAIALNSFITSMAAGNMFQTFKYNCILFCSDISLQTELLPHYVDLTSKDVAPLHPQNHTLVNDPSNNTLLNYSSEISGTNETNTETQPVIVFKNESHIFRNEDKLAVVTYAKIDLRKTMFAPNFWCNFVLGVALVTFIFATFFVVLLAMCSKGGKGKRNTLNRPQNIMYPILISSILLGVLNLLGSIVVKGGMRQFCAAFQIFTEDGSCSPLLNKFTLHERQGNFYLPYLVLSHAFNVTVVLFVGQVLVTFLRVIYAVDYQLYALEINEDDEEDRKFEVEDGQIVQERAL